MKEIKLTSDEQELFDLLKSASKVVAPSATLRVAGGWVRDKLLDKQSNDIDFMVDNMSGEKIARLITAHLGLDGPHVIEANPDASKHLETAGAKIPVSSGKEFDLDFAMARQEVYTDDSRIPEIQPATPEEDAFRRDLTINSLFYNVMTGELEDFTGKGLEDLKNNVIRTPEDPLKTFQDDPLRIFRTIRFTSRYNGQIDPETLQAMNDPSLREAIQQKVKKERVQEELFKTFKGPNPTVAVSLLKSTGILDDIIQSAVKGTQFEGKMAPFEMDQNSPHHELNVWDHTSKVVENILMYYPESDPEKRAIMVLTALMHDMGKLCYDFQQQKGDKTSFKGHEVASSRLAKMILGYLKFNNNVIEQVSKLSRHHMRLHSLERDKNLQSDARRLPPMRKFVRKMLEDNIDAMDVMHHTLADAYGKTEAIVSPDVVKKYQTLYSQLQQALSTMNVDPTNRRLVPVLNGKEIMSILNINSGPIIGEIHSFLKDQMDENPNISKDEAARLITEKFGPQIDNEERIRQASACPKHLLFQKVDDILEALDEKSSTKAITLMTELKDAHAEDENVYQHLASCMLKTLLLDRQQRNLELLTYVFNKSEDNFFDTDLCIPVLGILLLIKTGTKDKTIEDIFKRMKTMAKDDLKEMLKSLPDDVYHKRRLKMYREELNGRC